MSKCVYPKCPKESRHRHHIVYKPKAVIVGLCVEHHEDITICNTNATEKVRKKLSNERRWEIWQGWLAGEIKPVRTPNALAWIEQWKLPRRRRPPQYRKHSPLKRKMLRFRSRHMSRKIFNSGLTIGEARLVVDNAMLYLIHKDDPAQDEAIKILHEFFY